MATYQENWDSIWAEICLKPDGTIDLEQVKKELSDFSNIMDSVSEVYDTLTMGRISKVNTSASAVISEVQALHQEAIDEAVREATEAE